MDSNQLEYNCIKKISVKNNKVQSTKTAESGGHNINTGYITENKNNNHITAGYGENGDLVSPLANRYGSDKEETCHPYIITL